MSPARDAQHTHPLRSAQPSGRPGTASQRDLVIASLLRCPGARKGDAPSSGSRPTLH